ncbi:SCP2 sterol-binding domain-containing protein [Anaerobacillus sp. CMMVII]|uniref:SCP2 sterol-binding domain-containing protein n=1 Tax=Anaerobacillus sp. CMMVII TaxID=2755588 RepID=UPI0021B7B71C|nr:SCP2 sterol-binding domain-containing protein [Anaerobacillus sp. CMMVII]MCT8136820.1 SCP2 sterol-binding domain-containing protein [Anaerobacillus sp. CMMVII]
MMTVKETLNMLAQKMNDHSEGIKGVNTAYQFDLSGEEQGTFQVIIKDEQVQVFDEVKREPNCTLQLSDQNLLKLIAGNLNPTVAYMSGKLKIKGELGLALKLQSILKKYE